MELQGYFQSYEGYFWEWENAIHAENSVYETVSIPDGNTIAYEYFIMETLELLGADGLPPFGAFLLVLAATNPSSKESLDRIFAILGGSETNKKLWKLQSDDPLKEARKFLDMLATLPDSFMQGEKRKQLLQALFLNCHKRLSAGKAREILNEYRNHRHHLLRCGQKEAFSDANFHRDFSVIFRISRKFPTRISILNAMSGVPQLPQLEEELAEQQPVAMPKGFIQELMAEPKTFPVGSLIQRIWGGLNIPLHHAAPSMQPLGGISDLTNKGDFDKLLISEFANEDEVFMSRIANNEALYIKREVPPEADKFLRLLLIDSSLKNWGTPKILGFASALAIAKHPKTDIECRAFVLGNGYNEVKMETVEEVIDGLGHLGSGLDAGEDLGLMLDNHGDLKNAEVFLITSEDALKEHALQKAVSENYERIKYIISTDAVGNLNFYRVQNKGRKAIQHIYLPLDELWKEKPKERTGKTAQNKREIDFPESYPILFPLPANVLAKFKVDGDYYLLSNSRNLYKTGVRIQSSLPYSEHLGAKQLLSNLSIKSEGNYCLGRDAEGNFILVSFFPNDHLLSWHNLNTSEYGKRTVDDADRTSELVYNGGEFHFIDPIRSICHKIRKDGELKMQPVVEDTSLLVQYAQDNTALEFFKHRPGSNILQNCMPVFIDAQDRLCFNKHCLRLNTEYDERYHCFDLRVERYNTHQVDGVYDKGRGCFVFPEGSTVRRDPRGIMILESSDPNIGKIYMPASVSFALGLSTEDEFAGNEYFYDTENGIRRITIGDFHKRHVIPFIKHITDNAPRT